MTTVTYAWEFEFVINYDATIFAQYPSGTPALETKVKAAITNMRAIMRMQPGINSISQRVDDTGLYFKVDLFRSQAYLDKYNNP